MRTFVRSLIHVSKVEKSMPGALFLLLPLLPLKSLSPSDRCTMAERDVMDT